MLKPGGRLFLMCFSDEEPGTRGPRRVTRQELHDSFRQGWTVESTAQPVRYEVVPTPGFEFTEGGPKSWFAIIQRGG